MAEKADPNAPAKPETPPARKKGKTVIVIAAMLFIEAAVIIGAMKMLGPKTVHAADEHAEDHVGEEDKIVEVLVLEDKLSNSRQGVNYLYDTAIYVQVKKKHEAAVTDELNRFRMELTAEFMAIWRTADPRELQEPKLENLTRKAHAVLADRFGNDRESNEPIVHKCVIVSGPGFRVDS